MTDQIPTPPPVPPLPRRKVYLAIWNDGHPLKADIFSSDIPRWKPISKDEFFGMVEIQIRTRILAEMASADRQFGHMAMGL